MSAPEPTSVRRRGRRLTVDERARMRTMLAAGDSLTAIAAALDCSPSTVAYAKKNGTGGRADAGVARGAYRVQDLAPRPGHTIHLIRYELTTEGWQPRTVIGTYRGCTPALWRVETRDGIQEFDREEWRTFEP